MLSFDYHNNTIEKEIKNEPVMKNIPPPPPLAPILSLSSTTTKTTKHNTDNGTREGTRFAPSVMDLQNAIKKMGFKKPTSEHHR